jgi:pyruvate kinase
MDIRKTKIIATIGPASSSKEMLRALLEEGVDVCRLNFSHGEHQEYAEIIKRIREVDDELGLNTSILADLQGPKLRIGVVDGIMELVQGDELTITTEETIGSNGVVSTTYKRFPMDVNPGENVMLDDGKIRLEVIRTDGEKEVLTKVLNGGPLTSKKGMNLPKTKVSLPSLTKKDREDLEFIVNLDVDWIALSFVRSHKDLVELRDRIAGRSNARLIAKIEKPEALDSLDAIIHESDAIMIARGDLGVEVPMQKVPLIQKDIIWRCMQQQRPVIVATQMMDSMITNIMPTRAEVNDVANAVLDHADAVMLSGETSVGKHPIEVVRAMKKILDEVESYPGLYDMPGSSMKDNDRMITDAICTAAVGVAHRVDVKGIVTMTHSGYTAYKISSMRPRAVIFAFTSNKQILSTLNLVWGVRGLYYDKMVSTDHTIADIKHVLLQKGLVHKGEKIVNIASMPISEMGMSNMLKLSEV